MPLRLRDNLHWCLCAGRAIFLDLEHDRYFRLPPKAEAAFLRLADGTPRPRDGERLDMLLARGPISGGARAPSRKRRLPVPVADFVRDLPRRSSLRAAAAAFVYQLHAAWLLRRLGIGQATKRIETRAASIGNPPQDQEERLAEILAPFSGTGLILPAADRCLPRALALHALCCRNNIRTQVVIGVRADPFAAHCWVQREDLVLIGDYEQARLFTPIAVLG